MTRDEAIAYCARHEDRYVRDFGQIREGIRSHGCLMALLESGTVKPEQLPEYGMDLDWDDKDKD